MEPSTSELRSYRALGRAVARVSVIGAADEEVGRRIDRALRSAIRAAIPGSQKAKQIDAATDAARKAFLRYLR